MADSKIPVPFIMVPEWVWAHPDLGKVDVMVYMTLAHHADNKTRVCWPSQKLIMAESRVGNIRTLRTSLRRLEETGCIVVHKRHAQNDLYYLPIAPPKLRGLTDDEIEFYMSHEELPPGFGE
ncbi:MAG: helix-turn-helix domain-containing protein [Eggerthellaceae bacterium]|nr:helix-turn-helix domain-containing protein [Eggerthellaceae bacterium]